MSECRNCVECTAGNDCPVAKRMEREREEQRAREKRVLRWMFTLDGKEN